jgi:hypothetical protein
LVSGRRAAASRCRPPSPGALDEEDTVMIGFRRGTAAVLLLLAVAVVGCGGKRTGTITGTITFNGEKMERGTVTFYTTDEEKMIAKGGPIHLDGTYKIEDFPVGPVKITVVNFPNPGGGGLTLGGGLQPKDGAPQKNYFDMPGRYLDIPPRYSDRAKTDLTYEVKVGPQEHNIELKP